MTLTFKVHIAMMCFVQSITKDSVTLKLFAIYVRMCMFTCTHVCVCVCLCTPANTVSHFFWGIHTSDHLGTLFSEHYKSRCWFFTIYFWYVVLMFFIFLALTVSFTLLYSVKLTKKKKGAKPTSGIIEI